MKKLLILALVLGMAGLAVAGLQISVNGDKYPVDGALVLAPSQYARTGSLTLSPVRPERRPHERIDHAQLAQQLDRHNQFDRH